MKKDSNYHAERCLGYAAEDLKAGRPGGAEYWLRQAIGWLNNDDPE